MKHLILCREYPPAPSGGIGTYVDNVSRLLAEAGETVHVIGQMWKGAETAYEEKYHGKLIVHRVPCRDWRAIVRSKPSPLMRSQVARALYGVEFPSQSFAWLAGSLAERLVEQEGIDVVEAQEYEAPLYYFQLRRALGLGPQRCPPCIVHLHSPTEFIVHHNEWDQALSRWQLLKRLEDYSILSADALLCPSRFLSRQVASHYNGRTRNIKIIPYPLGEVRTVERQAEVWSTGSICYVGRLEKRKGILEWIGAAVAIAEQDPSVRFEFIGANSLDPNPVLAEELLTRLVPRHVQARFVFRGAVDRGALPQLLTAARIAAVPSRWENFPNSCIETMASGLPVIISPAGGMTEMAVEGQTGWVAESAEKKELEKALKRALSTPPLKLAEMGATAAQSIRHLCDSQQILEHQIRFRSTVMRQEGTPAVHSPTLRTVTTERGRAPRISLHDVVVDYPSKKGRDLDSFVELVAHDTESVNALTTYARAVRGLENHSRLPESLVALRCLLWRPSIVARILRKIAAKL